MLQHRLQCRYLVQHGPFHGLQGNIFFVIVFSVGCREISVPVPGAPPSTSSSSLTCAFPGLFLTLFSPRFSLPGKHFTLFKMCFHRSTTSLTDELSCVLQLVHCRAVPDLFLQIPPLQPSQYQTLITDTQYSKMKENKIKG